MTEEQQLAEYVLKHPALSKIKDRIDSMLLRKFREGTPEAREEVIRIMDSTDLFLRELKTIVDESIDINQPEDEKDEK